MACQIKELVEYILANPDKTKSVWEQVNKIVNPSTGKNQKAGINISSKSSDVLGRALTNKTYKKYPIEDVPGLIKPSVNTQDGLSAEGWYKANQSRKTAPKLDMKKAIEYDMDLMQRIIVAKFKQYPELVQQITAKGGKEFIENSEHTVGVAGSRWEGKGLDSNFIKVLAKAYEDLVSGETSDNDTKVGLDDNNTTTLEEELTYLNSKKTIKGTLPQKGQKVDFQLADGDTATGVIHQMLDGTMLGYADGKITELASGKYVITYKGGSVKDKFTEAITKLKTVSEEQKIAIEQAIKEGTFNKDIPKSKVLKMAVEARNTRIKKVAKDSGWKRYAAETKQVPGKYNDYYGAMEKIITKIVDPKVVTNVVGLMLEDVFNGKFQIVAGDYDPDTHTVQIAEKPRQMEIEMAVEEGLQEEAIRLYETTTENMAYRAKLIEDYVNKNRANALAYVISSVESVNGGHTTTHELIHAGSVNFMRDPKNANHPAVLRVKELYQEALAREEEIKAMMRVGDVYTEYWKKNEEEFISEALSNPQLKYALSNIKTVGKERLSKGLFAELVESLIKMLGLSKKTEDNLLEFTMDGFAAIMEAQAVELNRNSNVPAKIYHGFKGNTTPYINKEGNLVMKPSKNFGGKTTSVSFTHSLDTAYRYAAQVKGEGPLGYDFINAKVFEIETKYIDELLQRESQEEWAINTDKDVVIPKRAFKVIEHPLTSRLGEVEKEYPFKEFVRDVTMDHEFDGYGDERSYGNYFEEYLDTVIAEYDKDPELAKDIYDTMEYLSDGDYADLAITSESEVAQDKRDTMTVKEILAKVDKMREECE